VSMLSQKYFQSEKAAFRHLEAALWPDGPICPHCGVVDQAGRLKGVRSKPSKKNPEGVVLHGRWKCYACRKQFTVTVGTIFERAHIPLHKCLQAVHLMTASKKGISAHQLHRTLEITYKSAWFLAMRIREAMRDGTLAPMGGAGSIIEADETFYGQVEGEPKRRGTGHKHVILSLIERGGSARSFHLAGTRIADVAPVIRANLKRESTLMTDEAQYYSEVGREFARHDSVNHKHEEYVRGDAHTNTAEGFFSIFKRGMTGVYQHCKEKHLHRYLAEFDFRYSNRVALGIDDAQRASRAMKGITGKRLTYRAADKTIQT
jgi:transposase-like protein